MLLLPTSMAAMRTEPSSRVLRGCTGLGGGGASLTRDSSPSRVRARVNAPAAIPYFVAHDAQSTARHATQSLHVPTTEFEKKDRCADLPHRPRVLLGKMGLDGHDRGVKVIARALRDSGIHVIYSGLWQTPRSLAVSARDEDCDVVCASMMSNSHLALGPRLVSALGELGRRDIPIYMGGILPQEDIPTLIAGGVAKCFTTGVGLLDIVNAVRDATRKREPTVSAGTISAGRVPASSVTAQLARDISIVHDGGPVRAGARRRRPAKVIGITGSPGAGKSTIVAQLASEYISREGLKGRCAVVAFDPKSPITGGALLGDRLRVDFNRLDEKVYYRSLAIRGEDYHALGEIIELIGGAHCGSVGGAHSGSDGGGDDAFDLLFLETVGAGQNETRIRDHVDATVVVLTPGMGDAVQMDKAGILEIADMFVCNKADHPGEHELVRDLRDISGKRAIVETIATQSKGIPELLDAILGM